MNEKILGKIKTSIKIRGKIKTQSKLKGALKYSGYSIGDDYNTLKNKPKIEGVELKDNKTFEELGLLEVSNIELKEIFDKIFN